MSDAIRVSGLTKRYGSLVAVDNVSFEVAEGEIFGLIGPDGAGKSSIYRILATLSQPDAGEVTIAGYRLADSYERLRHIIGYMPERFSLYTNLTVQENLDLFASLFGVTVKENYDLIAPVFTQLAKFPDRAAGKLSGGMKQKLALSCALIHRPRILLLDEPTTGVDAVSRSEFWDMLGTLRESGITILVSTSYMDEATRCDRIAMIDRGHILIADTPDGLLGHLDEKLYNAKAANMFGLLTALRKYPEVSMCYTFGSTLHVVAGDGFDPSEIKRRLSEEGIPDAEIYPARGDIEDLFIKLTRNDRE